jgi:hypothetical protein
VAAPATIPRWSRTWSSWKELRIPSAIRLFKLPIQLPALGGLPFGRL